ncbi:MAG: efflux RND transporter periplasmic adaptor subunit [Planctomycetota bacterium]
MTKKTKRTLLVLLLLLAAAAASGWIAHKRERPVDVQTALVERTPLLRSVVTASGSIQAKEAVDIQAEIAGIIVELPVHEGDRVTKGQVLLKIDPYQTQADASAMRASALAAEADAKGQEVQIATAEASLARDKAQKASAVADLAQAEAAQERAQSLLRRKKELFDRKDLSPEDFEIAVTQEKTARSQVDAVNARIAQYDAQIKSSTLTIDQLRAVFDAAKSRAEAARVAMDRAEDWLKKTTIYATLDGVITALNVEKGERAVPGIQSNPQATLMTIADLSVIQAELLVDETDIVQIRLNDSVKVKVDALGDDVVLDAKVIEIGNAPVVQGQGGAVSLAAATSQEGKDFLVKAVISNPPAALRPGMSCEGDILTATRENPLVVPVQAITVREVDVDEQGRYVPPDLNELQRRREKKEERDLRPITRAGAVKKELQGVFVKGSDDRVLFRPVKTGITGEMDTELLEGLSGGEEIVIGPYKVLRALEEGQLVKVDNSRFRRFAKANEKPDES